MSESNTPRDGKRARSPRKIEALFGFIGVLIAMLGFWQVIKRVPWSYVESLHRQSGPFFRITANYLYIGKPLTLDFGLGCGGVVTTYKDKDHSVDFFGGPQLYGVKTGDDKAVVISTTGMCSKFHSDAPNAYMPSNFLPATVVYDDPTTLNFYSLYVGRGLC